MFKPGERSEVISKFRRIACSAAAIKRRIHGPRTLRLLAPICLGCLLFASCGGLLPSGQRPVVVSRSVGNVPKATGDVEIKWTGGGGPAHPPGGLSRVGQIVAVVAHDGGNPRAKADTITWSWFYRYEDPAKSSGAAITPDIGNSATWPEDLCVKPILGGNIVVHSGSRR